MNLFYYFIIFILLFAFIGHNSIMKGLYILVSFYTIKYSFTEILRKDLRHVIAFSKISIKLYKTIQLFLLVSVFFLLYSLFNIPSLWGIKYLGFRYDYIFRHYFIIYSAFIGFFIAFESFKNYSIPNINTKKLLLFLALCIWGSIGGSIGGDYHLILLTLGLQTITLLVTNTRNKLYLILIPLLYSSADNSTYTMIGLLSIIAFIFPAPIASFFKKNIILKFSLILILLIVSFVILSIVIMQYISDDANALWRLMVWTNEILSLKETYFTGVGYGSAYVTETIYKEVSNSNMYTNDFTGNEGLFVVANHSSILNMFYRMGVIGGILYISIILITLKWYSKIYRSIKIKKSRRYLYWALINWIINLLIICINPGLESPQFATTYLLSQGLLWGTLLHFQKQLYVVSNNNLLSTRK